MTNNQSVWKTYEKTLGTGGQRQRETGGGLRHSTEKQGPDSEKRLLIKFVLTYLSDVKNAKRSSDKRYTHWFFVEDHANAGLVVNAASKSLLNHQRIYISVSVADISTSDPGERPTTLVSTASSKNVDITRVRRRRKRRAAREVNSRPEVHAYSEGPGSCPLRGPVTPPFDSCEVWSTVARGGLDRHDVYSIRGTHTARQLAEVFDRW
jgi:hypothetical protein